MFTKRISTGRLAILVACVGLGLSGCGPEGRKTYPVTVKLDLDGGDPSQLAGSTIEVAQGDNPNVRAAGEIRADGTAALETLDAGVMRKGAFEGEYRVRIVVADDDPETRRRAARAVAPRFRKFETSDLTLRVPADGEVTLKLSSRDLKGK